METDPTYFVRRCREEWAAAELAVNPFAQARHVDLAIRYEVAARIDQQDPVAHEGPRKGTWDIWQLIASHLHLEDGGPTRPGASDDERSLGADPD